ncbi:FxsA family protein [Catenovulum sp. 2E275]|uniref:FxsA family protein n=1 Tax=Catenovulum sp. 2E275 TaxID=2980497 RepID=UPI0021D3D43C|nr:FxsA family protein [Catenovulum sp. 2E275]MCU4676299.1 FxsA family protein [Catenovulum sp. 2E275]
MLKLFILFVVLPIAEISLLLQVGDLIGGWTTLAIVILTAIVGAQLVRAQGLAALAEIKQKTAMGEVPAESITEGIMILVAGILLVTPGFITDTLGFLMTIPVTRKPFAKVLMAQFGQQLKNQSFAYYSSSQGGFTGQSGSPFSHSASGDDSSVIEGEWRRTDENKKLDK